MGECDHKNTAPGHEWMGYFWQSDEFESKAIICLDCKEIVKP